MITWIANIAKDEIQMSASQGLTFFLSAFFPVPVFIIYNISFGWIAALSMFLSWIFFTFIVFYLIARVLEEYKKGNKVIDLLLMCTSCGWSGFLFVPAENIYIHSTATPDVVPCSRCGSYTLGRADWSVNYHGGI